MSDLLYVHPETMKEVSFGQLPKVYRDSKNADMATKYEEKVANENKPIKRVYKEKGDKGRMETDDGHELYVPLRKKELGGIKFEKDERYDPKRNWRYPYGKQLVEIRKPKSHEFGERKWKAIYTKDYSVVHGAVKFEMIRKIADNIDDAKRKWQNGMLGVDEHKSICAAMCAMSNESPFRSGNINAATRKKNKTYGITTLKCKHIKPMKDKDGKDILFINFSGKDQVDNRKYIKNPVAVIKIKQLMKGKEPDDFLFTDKNGEFISASELNAYCKSIGIPHFHFFRHIRASQRFKEAVDKILEKTTMPDMPTSKEVAKIVVKAATEASSLLGNKPDTCIKNYIAPQLIFDVFKRFDLPVPEVYKNLARIPSNVTEKDLQEIMQDKYFNTKRNMDVDLEEDDEDEDAEASAATLEEVVNNDEPLFDDSKTTFREDEQARNAFEDYALEYEYDDDDIINDPKVLDELAIAYVMVPTDFTPDFDLIEQHVNKRDDQYHTDKSTEYSCRDADTEVDKWGYNDYVGVTPKEMNKKMMDDAKRDYERLLNEVKK